MLEFCLALGVICKAIQPHTKADILDKSFNPPIVYCIENPTDDVKTIARVREGGEVSYALEPGLKFCDDVPEDRT